MKVCGIFTGLPEASEKSFKHSMDKSPLRVLFIDDSVDDVELSLSELKREAYAVASSRMETVDEMSTALGNDQWDAIVCDCKMPQLSPEKSLEIYHGNECDIPFIVMSGVIEAKGAISLLKQGAHDFVDKNHLSALPLTLERELVAHNTYKN